MSDSNSCFRGEVSLNELLHEPIVAMLMSRDGVRSDDIRALYRRMAKRDPAARGHAREPERYEGCLTP